MNVLFIDTETTGKPIDYRAPASKINNWPRLVQIGIITYQDGRKDEEWEEIIKPEGFNIPSEAAGIHGITTERAMVEGERLSTILYLLRWLSESCDAIVGHNVNFDLCVIGAEFYRLTGENPLERKPAICTMKSSIDFCAIPSPKKPGAFKWPTLEELYIKLFGRPCGQTHTALDDIRRTAECFFELEKRGIIKVTE